VATIMLWRFYSNRTSYSYKLLFIYVHESCLIVIVHWKYWKVATWQSYLQKMHWQSDTLS